MADTKRSPMKTEKTLAIGQFVFLFTMSVERGCLFTLTEARIMSMYCEVVYNGSEGLRNADKKESLLAVDIKGLLKVLLTTD